MQKLWPGALGIALLSFTESINAGKDYLTHNDVAPNPNRELFALGVANLVASFFQTMPAGAGDYPTAINSTAGARSQVTGLITAACAILVLLFLTPIISKIPQAPLAAIAVAIAGLLLNPADFRTILKTGKMDKESMSRLERT